MTPVAATRRLCTFSRAAENSGAKEPVPRQQQSADPGVLSDAPRLEEGGKEEQEVNDGQPKSPAGLTLEGVYRRLKLETQGLDDGIVGLESKDTDYGVRGRQH